MPKPSHIIKIGEACEILGIHPNTLRRWEREKKIVPISRTAGKGTRYYDKNVLLNMTQKQEYWTYQQVQEYTGVVDVDLRPLLKPLYRSDDVINSTPDLLDYAENSRM